LAWCGSNDRSLSAAKPQQTISEPLLNSPCLEQKLQQSMSGVALNRLCLMLRSTEQIGTPTIIIYH